MSALHIQIDLTKSHLGDWELVSRAQKGVSFDDIPDWVEFLDRVLVGGKTAFPMTALQDVIKAVADQLAADANPKAPTA
jgi:hypothetical protein